MKTNIKKDILLIVDDVPTNLKLLLTYLHDFDYEVLVAQNGKDALAKVERAKPDLILLDVMMPIMDGFEACRRLKMKKETRDIPIIFMTALTETIDKVKGFEMGAVDYITKPIQHEEVLARITTHLSLRNLQKTLEQKNQILEQQTLELKEQNEQMDAFTHVVVRDLKKPLVRQAGFTSVLKRKLIQLPDEESIQLLGEIEESRQKMGEVVDDLLLLIDSHAQEINIETLDMKTIVEHVLNNLSEMIEKYGAKISTTTNWMEVWGYALWVKKVWTVYIENALKYGGKPPYLELGQTSEGDTHIRFWVRDNGPGFTAEQQSHLFVPFTRISQARIEEGYGLKLSIVRLLIEKSGGQVGVESQVGQGSTFYFTLPIPQTTLTHYHDL
jgi:two-component system sensor histidine kinase/response regulator